MKDEPMTESDRRNTQRHLRIRLLNAYDHAPEWFDRRMLEETGLSQSDLIVLHSVPTSGSVVLEESQLDAVDRFLRSYFAGGITETKGEQVVDERSPFGGLPPEDKPLTPEPAPEPPRITAKARIQEIAAKIKQTPPAPAPPRVPPPVPEAESDAIEKEVLEARGKRALALLERYRKLKARHPNGFANAFRKHFGLHHSFTYQLQENTSADHTLQQIHDHLVDVESGKVTLDIQVAARPKKVRALPAAPSTPAPTDAISALEQADAHLAGEMERFNHRINTLEQDLTHAKAQWTQADIDRTTIRNAIEILKARR